MPSASSSLHSGDTAAKRGAKHMEALAPLLADEAISDIMINRHDRVFIERAGVLMPSPVQFASPSCVAELAQAMIALCGRQEAAKEHPIIDGMLPGGSRVNIILPPVAVEGASISIRKFPIKPHTLDSMQEKEQMTPAMAAFLKAAASGRASILIAGNTSSGKTTLMSALSLHIAPQERVVTIEDTPELQMQLANVVRLEMNCGRSNAGCTARELVKGALRARPDRIIMGEVRGEEAFELVQAVNTGHEGSMATLHANSPRETLTRLEHMISMAGMHLPPRAIRQQIASALDLFIQMQRDAHGARRISHIAEIIGMEGDTLVLHDHFMWDAEKKAYRASLTSSRVPKIQAAIDAAKAA